MSPPSRRRLHRQATNTTPSSSSSRTESPRFTKEQESQYGVIKMKKSSARLNPNRNSASLQTSTLQEDLIKLIGKDFEHAGKTINSKLKVSYFLLLFELKGHRDIFLFAAIRINRPLTIESLLYI